MRLWRHRLELFLDATIYLQRERLESSSITYISDFRNSVGMKTRRPNLLQFNDWMVECVNVLEKSPHQTDQRLAVWFQLQRITDESLSSFSLDDTSSFSILTESRVQAVLRWFDKQIEIWRKNTPHKLLTGKAVFFFSFPSFS